MPAFSKQEEFKVVGFYEPTTDSVAVLDYNNETFLHELAHRVFSVYGLGFYSLRVLVGISHSLLFALLDAAFEENIRLRGKSINTLEISRQSSTNRLMNRMIKNLKSVEVLIDACLWSLIPAAEIAAIDFVIPKDVDTWVAKRFVHTEEIQKRKDLLINSIASGLADRESRSLNPLYSNIKEELLATWEAYCTIEDSNARRVLLEIAMSSNLVDNPTNPNGLPVATNTLHLIREWVPKARQPGAIELLEQEWQQRGQDLINRTDKLKKRLATYIPATHLSPLRMTIILNYALFYSLPTLDNPIPADLRTSPAFSLLVFWVENDNQRHVRLNSEVLLIAETLEKKGLLNFTFHNRAYAKDWWRWLVALEVFRKAFKYEVAVACPFRGWQGVNCIEGCPISAVINLIKDLTDLKLAANGATCDLEEDGSREKTSDSD